jgi:hypothetical protein
MSDKEAAEPNNGLNLDLDQQAQQSILNTEIGRRYEICFKHTRWQLNDSDGQTPRAQFLMKNILYTKVSNQQELDCVEHTLEIESCRVQDLQSELQLQQVGLGAHRPKAGSGGKAKKPAASFDTFVLKGLFDNTGENFRQRG